MAERSKIGKLPSDTRVRIDTYLGKQDRSVDEFTDFLRDEIGLEISRTAAHRYQRTRSYDRIRKSREITEAFAPALGDAALQGKQGRLLVELLRSHMHDFLTALDEEDSDKKLDPKSFANIAKTLVDMSRSLRLDQDFEIKLLQTFAKTAADVAVAAIEEQGKKHGYKLPQEALAAVREQIYGIVERTP